MEALSFALCERLLSWRTMKIEDREGEPALLSLSLLLELKLQAGGPELDSAFRNVWFGPQVCFQGIGANIQKLRDFTSKNAKCFAPFGKWEALVAWSPHSHSVTIIRH